MLLGNGAKADQFHEIHYKANPGTNELLSKKLINPGKEFKPQKQNQGKKHYQVNGIVSGKMQ